MLVNIHCGLMLWAICNHTNWRNAFAHVGYKLIAETGQSVAMICHMYNLVSDKRQPRNTLLSGLVKVLEVDLTSSEVEVTLFCRCRYLLAVGCIKSL